jgi:FKBP12-rapamycin complex-associated protein
VFAASKSINHVSSAGGAFNESFMDHQVPAAINLIQPDKQESPRYAGVLILKELARNSPTYFYAHIGLVFDNILVPLRDQRVIVREASAELLSTCLEIVAERERANTFHKSPYLDNILRDAQAGLRHTQPEIIHASLLAYRVLLLRGGMVRIFESFTFLAYSPASLCVTFFRTPLNKSCDLDHIEIPSFAS